MKMEHLKRALMEKCPPENIKGEDPLQEDYVGRYGSIWTMLF
jgi:hypothetical protein